MIEILDLKYLAASVSSGNFGRAAKMLGVTTSTVSRRISNLEDKLGLVLFERGSFGIRLTAGGSAVMRHVRRALAELEAVERAGSQIGLGHAGEIRLGVRLPPIGEPLMGLLAGWHEQHPEVLLTISEMNSRALATALRQRRLDIVIATSFTQWPDASVLPLYREPLMAAVPLRHPLAARAMVNWDDLRGEILLVQEWDESRETRELYACMIGTSARFRTHAASKQSIFALVCTGFGITLATRSWSDVAFPGVVFKPIAEENAWLQMALISLPEVEDAVLGRFVAFMRDESRARMLL